MSAHTHSAENDEISNGGGSWLEPTTAKASIAVGLFCGTMLFAAIPVLLSRRSHSRRSMVRHVLTGLSCLGGGVFLATCFLHLIPEATEKMEHALKDSHVHADFPLPYAVIIAGFLLVLLLEQFIHSYSGMGHGHSHGHPNIGVSDLGSAPVPNYGSIHREELEAAERQTNGEVGGSVRSDEKLKPASEVVTVAQNDPQDGQRHKKDADLAIEGDDAQNDDVRSGGNGGPTDSSCCNFFDEVGMASMNKPTVVDTGTMDATASDSDDEDRMTTVSMHGDPGSHSAFRAVVMVFALSLHSIFEGIAVGLQPSTQQVIQLFGAIIVHKCVIAVTLSTNLVSSGSRLSHYAVFCCLAVFAAMAPLGIGIAILMNDAPEMVNGVLQCVAAGTFVYITFFEILPHELNSRNTEGSRVFKIFMLLAGIALIIAIMSIFPDHD